MQVLHNNQTQQCLSNLRTVHKSPYHESKIFHLAL